MLCLVPIAALVRLPCVEGMHAAPRASRASPGVDDMPVDDPEDGPSAKHADTATVFVSHAWKYTFWEICDTLFHHFAKEDPAKTFVWCATPAGAAGVLSGAACRSPRLALCL